MPGTPWASATAACSPARQRPEVGRDLRGDLEADLARRIQPGDERLRERLEGIGAVGHELLGHGDRGRFAGRLDDLGEPGQPWDRGEAGVLRQERGHLEVGVEAWLEASIDLDEHGLAEHDRGVALVRGKVPFRGIRDPIRASPARAGRRGPP